jgi:hypothetical protein
MSSGRVVALVRLPHGQSIIPDSAPNGEAWPFVRTPSPSAEVDARRAVRQCAVG